MNMKKLGTSGVQVSEMILGCWVMGGAQWGGADDNESIRAIHAAYDAGINTLDTAEAYNDGYSESIIGKAIQGHPNDYVISSKALNCHSKYDQLKAACENSLKRLGRDYLDVYFLHWPSHFYGGKKVPLEETMAAMSELKKEGKIRAIGLSNFSVEEFKIAMEVDRVDVYQPPFNILWRRMEDENLPYCIENGISVIPYSPIAQGLLSGKFSIDSVFPDNDIRSNTPLFLPENRIKALELIEKLRPIAEKYRKTLAQLAIKWVMQFPGITAPIVGGRTDKQVLENVGACGWKMEQSDFEKINTLSKDFWRQMSHYNHFFDTAVIEQK